MKINRFTKINCVVLFLPILIFALGETAFSATYYVRQGGTAVWNATTDCANPANAMSPGTHNANDHSLSPGDIVYICDDGGELTSSDSGVITIDSSGSEGNPVLYSNAPGDSPVLNAQDSRWGIRLGVSSSISYVTVQGLEVYNGKDFTFVLGNNTYPSSNIIVQDCNIHTTSSSAYNKGTNLYGVFNNSIVRKNHIHDNGAEDHCIYIAGESNNNVVEYNYIHDCDDVGVLINGGSGHTPDNNIIRYNWIQDNGWSGVSDAGGYNTLILGNIFVCDGQDEQQNHVNLTSDSAGTASSNAKLYNNVFYGDHDQGIYVGADCTLPATNVNLSNNIFYTTGVGDGWMLYVTDSFCSTNTLNTVEYNQYHDFGTLRWHYKGTEYNTLATWATAIGGKETNSQTGDPKFTSAGTDFTLSSDSPCIDAGDSSIGPSYGYILNANHNSVSDFGVDSSITLFDQDDYGSGWEIGAYGFFVSHGKPPSPPENLRISYLGLVPFSD